MPKKILIDECLPKQLAGWLAPLHDAKTVQAVGWANVKNGKLLRLANDAGFDVFVTADRNMYFQQNFTGLRLSAIVIPNSRKRLVQESVNGLVQSIGIIAPGQKIVMDMGPDADVWASMTLRSVEQEEHHSVHVFAVPGPTGS